MGAKAACLQILAVDSRNAEALLTLARICRKSDEHQEAVAHLQQLVENEPFVALYRLELGITLFADRQYIAAENSFRAALELNPSGPITHLELGMLLLVTGQVAEAERHCREAVRLNPSLATTHLGLAKVLRLTNRLDEAEASCLEAINLEPHSPLVHGALGDILAVGGRLREGFSEFERAWRTQFNHTRPSRMPVESIWNGEDLSGRVLLLYEHSGFGEIIQFCRYIGLLPGDPRVIVEAPPALAPLLSNLRGVSCVVKRGDPLPPFDFHSSLFRLPFVFGTTLETVPGITPYISSDRHRVRAWQQRLVSLKGLRVGLVWAGSQSKPWEPWTRWESMRSIDAAALGAFEHVPGVDFVSVQTGPRSSDVHQFAAPVTVHDWTSELRDFAETAALIDCLDVLISVDTAAAHLAGALAKPVWLLNRRDTCFRWMLNRDDSPWYPSVRQFRQLVPGDWRPVIANVMAALRAQCDL